MPTFAILGATGKIGGTILNQIKDDPSIKIRCFVRSAQKLKNQIPDLETNKRVQIFEGSLSDITTLAECIAPCDAVLSCIAATANVPGCSTAIDTAHSVIAALCHIRCVKKSSARLPRIIVLSSCTINDHLCRNMSPVFHRTLRYALKYTYDDLENAEAYYRLHQSWMTAIFMQPGGLVDDEQVGHVVSTEKQHTFLSFKDLAAAMVECAEKDSEDTEWDWKGVSVLPKGKTRFNPLVPVFLVFGLTFTTFPSLYWVGQQLGAFP